MKKEAQSASGVDTNGNNLKEIDCSHLVWEALKSAGCKVPYFTTSYLNDYSLANKKPRYCYPGDYYDQVGAIGSNGTTIDVKPGDVILFNGHMGIVESIWWDPVVGAFVGTFFHSEGRSGAGHPTTSRFIFAGGKNPNFHYGDEVPITKFLRPKCYCGSPLPAWPEVPAGQGRRVDPLILDLVGSGITTVGLAGGIHFDQDGNGFQEATGWVAPGSGLLVLDRDGNQGLDTGNELFGDYTYLPNGTRALNGFQALTFYDSNGDGRIDARDPVWSQLKVWQYDVEDEQDFEDSEVVVNLTTLDELGITAIHLESTITNRVDDAGNTEVRSGLFEWADGRTGSIAEYRLQRDTSDTLPAEFLEVPPEIGALPDLNGYGNVYRLQQAMVRDSSGELKALVEAFVAEDNPANRETILDQVIFKWTGADSVASDARGPFMDGRKIVALEELYGQSRSNPDAALATAWNETYRQVFENFYSRLIIQTHLKDLYDKITYTWNDEEQQYYNDMNAVISELQIQLTNNPEQGRVLLSEFARSMRGLGHSREDCLACREIFIEMDPSLGWLIDSGGLPVLEYRGWGHVDGTNASEAIQGTLIDPIINALNGDDVVYGSSRNEVITNDTGDALLVGGGGSDTIWAGPGDDILDGGADNDTLYGEAGNDTYIFRRGSGQDAIIDIDATAGNVDTIWLGSNLTPDDLVLQRSGNNLVVKIKDTTDTLTVRSYFWNNSELYKIEQIQFMDGTVWTDSDIAGRIYLPTEGDDVLYGGTGVDVINGLGGDDTIYGQAGDDLLHGDQGNDTLSGGAGDDILDGGAGNDILGGGDKDNYYFDRWVVGANGNDTYLFGRGWDRT